MVVDERAVGCVDEVVRGGVAGGRGQGGGEGHSRRRWRTEGEKGGEGKRGVGGGRGLGPPLIEGKVGRRLVEFTYSELLSKSFTIYSVLICAVTTL